MISLNMKMAYFCLIVLLSCKIPPHLRVRMIVLNVWNLSTNKGNGSKDSLSLYTNWPHVIVQLPHALGKGNITGREKLEPMV